MTAKLNLFGSPETRSLQAENVWLRERLEHAKVAFRKIRAELKAVQRERDSAQRELDACQRDVRFWKGQYELERMIRTMVPARPTPQAALEPMVKKLLTLCHPDKWSAGQPATALAHELTVVLNDVRTQLETQL
jgi:hypothetical protein